MLIALVLTVGILLSAFFSGSETGFYRVTRVRLALDAKSGSWIARSVLWLLNRPSIVVATTLIGNNLANYLVSFGFVLLGQTFLSNWSENVQTMFPVLMTPFLFIYGELLPKYLFFQSPYLLLRRCAPLMIVCVVLFLPVSLLVLLLERMCTRFLGKDPLQVASAIEGQELQSVLVEGQEAGLLSPIQREVSQNIFTYGVRPVRQFAVPVRALPLVGPNADRDAILAQANRAQQPLIAVYDEARQSVTGYYVAIELQLQSSLPPKPHPAIQVAATDTCIQVLTSLQSARGLLGQVVDPRGKTIGLVTKQRLMALLLTES
jgi:putative hemolysin